MSEENVQAQPAVIPEGLTRKAYIRKLFQEGWKRSDIAKHLGVKYQIVFAATKDLENEHHPKSGTRGSRGRVLMPDGTPRVEYIRAQVAAGRSRKEVAEELGISYQQVYQATKDMTVGRKREEGEPAAEVEELAAVEAEGEEEAEEDLDLLPPDEEDEDENA